MNILTKLAIFLDPNSTPDAKIKYVKGDATQPIGNGNKVIIHCCNDIGAWGAGFVIALSKRSKTPELCYKEWHKTGESTLSSGKFKLGNVQIAPYFDASPFTVVANMIGQHGCGIDEKGNPPIRYSAIRKCLKKVCSHCLLTDASVHAPRFGSDLAGGDWNIIEKIIEEELTMRGISVTVYNWN